MMEIFWTMLASRDRKRIREYIAEQNLIAAIELDERIGYSASNPAGQPYKGRNGRVEGTRERLFTHILLFWLPGSTASGEKCISLQYCMHCTRGSIEELSGYKTSDGDTQNHDVIGAGHQTVIPRRLPKTGVFLEKDVCAIIQNEMTPGAEPVKLV